jgi:ABC-type polysaccharide/polyol phosphate export permease
MTTVDAVDATPKLPSHNFWHHTALAWHFAWSDTRARYKRSVLGPFWLVLATIFGVVGLGFLWSILLKTDRSTFMPSLTIGMVLWSLISASITQSASVFANNASVIKNIRTPPLRISLQMLMQQIINLLHNLVVVLAVLLFFPKSIGPLALLALPGLLLVLVNLLWVVQVLGFVGARFRDFDPLVSSLMPMLFFLSPVIFRSQQLGAVSVIMSFNPIAYWIDIVRNPLLGTMSAPYEYAVVIGMAVIGWWLALSLTRAKAHRLPYWV